MKQRVLAAIAIFVALIAVLTIVRQRTGNNSPVEKRIDKFMACVSDTLKEGQKREIRATLEHFQQMIDAGMVARKDADDIIHILDHYIDAGTITRQELNVFLAKVGYYSIRMTPENQDIEGDIKPPDHPLLESGGAVDSTSHR